MQSSNEDVTRILKAKDHYEVFGISKMFMENPDSKEELKKKYRKLSLKVHPDKNPVPHASEAFQRLTAAYDYLTRDTVKVRDKREQVPDFFQPNSSFWDEFTESTSHSEKKQKPKCGAKCKDQSPCAKSAKEGSLYCSIHKNYNPNDTPAKPESKTKIRCGAKTKTGNPCGNSAKDGSPYCKIHHDYDPNVQREEPPPKVKCGALNGGGKPCANFAKVGSSYCGIHKNYSLV